MRATTFVVILLLVGAFAPTAAAAPTSLAIVVPEGPFQSNTTVPVTLRLTLSQYICHEDAQLKVALRTNASEGVKALFERSSVAMPIPARSTFMDEHVAEVTVNLSVRAIANGSLELLATMEPSEPESCFAPGGFEGANATLARSVVLRAAAAPAEPAAPQQPPNPATPPRTPPTTPRPGTCAPDTTCGRIGEYQAPTAESVQEEGAKGTPGLGAIGAMLAMVLVAVVARRRI